jgi:hypothetical protein
MPNYIQGEPKSGGALFVPPGFYDVEVIKATEKESKAKNEMIVLDCQIKLPGGRPGPDVSEFLVFTKKSSWKVDQVRAACGQAVVPGETKNVEPEHFDGAVAVVEIGTKPGDKNPDQTFNTIERWLLPDEAKAVKVGAFAETIGKPAPKKADDNLDDEIPF